MAKFVLLLHDNMSTLSRMSPAEMQKIVARYNAWSAKLGGRIELRAVDKM